MLFMSEKDNPWLVPLLFTGLAISATSLINLGLFYSIIIALLVIVGIVNFIGYRKLESNKDKLKDSHKNLKDNWKE